MVVIEFEDENWLPENCENLNIGKKGLLGNDLDRFEKIFDLKLRQLEFSHQFDLIDSIIFHNIF